MVNKIVTLDDDKHYCILNEISYDGKRYCLGVEYFEDSEDVGSDYYFFEEVLNGDEIYLEPVTNKELNDYLVLKIGSLNDERKN